VELILMLLAPLPIGFFVKNRTAGFIAYLALQAFVFTFQSVELVIAWAGGSTEAFGPFPKADNGEVLAYGVVNLVIYGIGLGLLYLGQRLALRRSRRAGAVQLDPAAA
jgi:hypothetical protein